jgi:uncharacterized protein
MVTEQKWWERKQFSSLNKKEWESLCDRCGLCCLHKLENDETKDVFYTSVTCALFDSNKCECTQYKQRLKLVPDCINITPKRLPKIVNWLPESCAYRRLYMNQPLPSWHPLLNKEIVTYNVKKILGGQTISENLVGDDDLEDYIIEDEIF